MMILDSGLFLGPPCIFINCKVECIVMLSFGDNLKYSFNKVYVDE